MNDAPQDGPRRPRAFRLEPEARPAGAPDPGRPESGAPEQWRAASGATVAVAPDPFAAPPPVPLDPEGAVEAAQRDGVLRRALFSWGGLFWSALGGLVSLGIGLWTASLIDALFARSMALGWVGLALAGLVVLALAVLGGREAAAILRQRRIAAGHIAIARAREADDTAAARKQVADLLALYAARPETARARATVAAAMGEIVDGRDLIDIAERNLMRPLDERARREIAAAARRTSVVTALAPRAILDVLFVAAQTVRLVRRISEIYGGRPGMLGFFRLARSVLAHLAITGSMAAGDTLLQQVLGHGIAAKISAKLGEGVLNGLLTARVGLSAVAVCRPMPFAALDQPGVSDVAPFLFGAEKKEPAPSSKTEGA